MWPSTGSIHGDGGGPTADKDVPPWPNPSPHGRYWDRRGASLPDGAPSLVLTTDPKPRLRWTADLHEHFVDAFTQLAGPRVRCSHFHLPFSLIFSILCARLLLSGSSWMSMRAWFVGGCLVRPVSSVALLDHRFRV